MNDQSKKRMKIFALGFAAGLLIFFSIYGFSVVNVQNDSFLINGYIEKDIAQHYRGWVLFRNSPWQFPLGVGQNLAYPYGTAVSYTDSIPLLAIFFKIFRSILPQTFQYFGIFIMLCFGLQGGFGALLVSLFTESRVFTTLSAGAFCLMPVLIERRFRHCGLTAQFLILRCLYFYFKNKGKTDFKAVLPFFVINRLSITIHPYFLPFTFGIMFAFCLENFFMTKEKLKAVLYIISSMALTVFVGWIIGAFYIKGEMAAYGYGVFSFNLNSFYNPTSKGFSNWSKFIGVRPFNNVYQIEGFGYLGLGFIALIPVACIAYLLTYKTSVFKKIWEFIKNNFGIIFSTAALFIFAIGNNITFGGLNIFHIPFPQPLIDNFFCIFRANGRFAWLLLYLILLFILYGISLIKFKHLPEIALAFMLVLQTWDISGALISKHAYFTGKEGDLQGQVVSNNMKNKFWDDLIENYDVFFNYAGAYYIDLPVKVGKAGKAVNGDFTARIDREKYAETQSAVRKSFSDGTADEKSVMLTDDNPAESGIITKTSPYSVYKVDGVYVTCQSIFTAKDLTSYTDENFEIIKE